MKTSTAEVDTDSLGVPTVRWAPSATWPEEGEPYASAVETHISTVLFVGDRAYKMKKPVKLAFLDLSSAELRHADAEAEVKLNSRLSPDVYLGVAELVASDDSEREPIVVMRRLPARRRLSTLVVDGVDVTSALRDAARRVAKLHAGLPALYTWDLAERMCNLWEQGCQQLQQFTPDVIDPAQLEEVRRLATEYVRGRLPLFEERVAGGRLRDGHGDLLADDIFCLDDGVRILDCLEFDKALRAGDVLADAAFLAMDLERLGRPDLAEFFLQEYAEFTAETHPLSLAHHYIAYRAFVRAKISCLRASVTGDAEDTEAARGLFRLCLEHLVAGRPKLVVLGGLPGTGKSTLAEEFAGLGGQREEWTVLSSDAIRKELAAQPITASLAGPYGEGAYDSAHTEAVYGELLRRAARSLERGVSAVLDASWSSNEHRERALGVGSSLSAAVSEICCRTPSATAMERLQARRSKPSTSDASPEIRARMADRFDPWPSAVVLDTSGPAEQSVTALLTAVAAPRTDRPYIPPD